MSQLSRLVSLATLLLTVSLSLFAAAQTEVLYVTEAEPGSVPLSTYNVNPKTAVATEVGSATLPATSIAPLTLNNRSYIYVWNATDVWAYVTNSKGVPEASFEQHLTFHFPHSVTSFAVDPKGNFAYAAMTWFDSKGNEYASVVLFDIDASTGKLINTGKQVASYGPNNYVSLLNFFFGASGLRLYASSFDNAPYTCIRGYDYYTVNQKSGSLGSQTDLTEANCNTDGAAAITDRVTVVQSSCCGQGTGYLTATQTATGKTINCNVSGFCGDEVYFMYIDPASKNLFYGDADQQLTYVAHFDFPDGELNATGSTIPGDPPVYFSPDSRVVYAQNSSDIGIYAFQDSTGELGASTSIPESTAVNIATTTLP